MGFRPDAIERQLAHAERDKVRASYNQAEYMAERRGMMDAWASVVLDLEPKLGVFDRNSARLVGDPAVP